MNPKIRNEFGIALFAMLLKMSLKAKSSIVMSAACVSRIGTTIAGFSGSVLLTTAVTFWGYQLACIYF